MFMYFLYALVFLISDDVLIPVIVSDTNLVKAVMMIDSVQNKIKYVHEALLRRVEHEA